MGRFAISVYDVRGSRVVTLTDRALEAGRHLIQSNGRTAAGNRAASGIYLLRVEGVEFEHTKKLVLLE